MKAIRATKSIWVVLLATFGISFSSLTLSYNFTPTQLEYLSSSEICKYALAVQTSNAGKRLSYIPQVRSSQWKDLVWKAGGWHYCGGAIKIKRALTATDATAKQRQIKEAISNIGYSRERIDPRHPWFAGMSISLAEAFTIIKAYDKARASLEKALEFHPENPALHSALALIEYKQEKYTNAMKLYQKARQLSESESPEILYSMGLTAFRLGNLKLAQKYALEAKNMGYPLTGLQNLIENSLSSK